MCERVDQRTIRCERDDEALAEVEKRRDGWLEQELALARLFCRIDRKAAYVTAGCGSVQQFASRRGYDAPRSLDLARLGYALEAEPDLEALLGANEIGFAAAVALGRIYQDQELLAPGDEWVRWARFERLVDLRRRIRQRVESVRQGQCADVLWSAHVTGETAEKLGRCQLIASRKAGYRLTHGQLLDLFSTGYLLEHDDLVVPESDPEHAEVSRRRLPPTEERPHDRTIPAEVVRALEARSGGLCEFGSCERLAHESCHLVAHRVGSGREVRDLVRGCRLHHKLYDAGRIRFVGWTESTHPAGANLPRFEVLETGETLEPKPRPRRYALAGSESATVGPAHGLEQWMLRALGARLRKRLARRGAERAPPNAEGP